MTVGSSDETLSGFDTSDDLDAFSNDFFQKKPPEKVEEPVDEDLEGDEPLEEVETDEPGDAPETEADEEDDEEDGEPEPAPKKKSASDRIKELTAKNYETERQANLRIKALEDKLSELAEKQPAKPEVGKMPDGAPDPQAANEDGTPVYELGEFDPKYITDLTRFTIKTESDAAASYRQKAEHEAAVTAARETAQANWKEKLTEAQTEIPDIEDKIRSLDSIVANVPQDVGQYYVDVIMSLENGPQVLAYLADNPTKAQEIISSGVASATVALGRLDSRVSKPARQEQKVQTKAPKPAAHVPRGTSGRFGTRADTDDLDAFTKEFFRKK